MTNIRAWLVNSIKSLFLISEISEIHYSFLSPWVSMGFNGFQWVSMGY
jgi:hypothetical protein